MKVTKSYLKQIIKEELTQVSEAVEPLIITIKKEEGRGGNSVYTLNVSDRGTFRLTTFDNVMQQLSALLK